MSFLFQLKSAEVFFFARNCFLRNFQDESEKFNDVFVIVAVVVVGGGGILLVFVGYCPPEVVGWLVDLYSAKTNQTRRRTDCKSLFQQMTMLSSWEGLVGKCVGRACGSFGSSCDFIACVCVRLAFGKARRL